MRRIILASLMAIGCGKAKEQPVTIATGILKNKVLNGAMVFDQNKDGGVYLSPRYTEIYSLDQWRYCGGADGSFQIERVTSDAPGFPYALKTTVVQTQVLHQINDNHHIEYPIEGKDISDMSWGTTSAKDVTISFLARASKTGTKPFALMNGINSRSIVSSYSIPVANQWTQVVIHITGDQVGLWTTSEWTFGVKLLWSLGVGSQYSRVGDNTWVGYASWNATGSDQLLEEPVGSTLELTGVQFEIGSTATTFEYLDYDIEKKLLERYYIKTENGTVTNNRLGGS